LEFNVPFQHKYGYIRDEFFYVSEMLSECRWWWWCSCGGWRVHKG